MPHSIVWRLPSDAARFQAAFFNGAVFVYPTEAVYGLGGNPADADVVRKIVALKRGRPIEKGLIMVAGHWSQCEGWVIADADARVEMDRLSQEQPTTFILSAGEKVAANLGDAKTGRVALRISTHPVVQALCAVVGQPLISTSANYAGKPAAMTVTEIADWFPNLPIVAGELGGATRPSRIIDWFNQQVIRE